MASARTRFIIEIVRITKHPRLILIFLALAVAGQLQAQIDFPAPDVPVPESGAEDQTAAAPPPELTPGPPVQIRPDEGSPVAGTEIFGAEFNIGRHLFLSASLSGGYNDNVNLTPTGSPSWYANPTANFRYQFGSARLAMDLLTGAGFTYYFDHPGGRDYDPLVYLVFSLAYKAAPRWTLNLSSNSTYQSQPALGTAFSSLNRLGNYFRSENRLFAHYQLSPRWSSITGYGLSALEYERSASSRNDRLEHTFSEQLRYLWMPTTSVTGQYRFRLNETPDTDSTSHFLTVGLEQSFSPRLSAGLHTGVQFRSENNGEQSSPFVETILHYELGSQGGIARRQSGAGTNIIWTTRYSIEESDVQQGVGSETFRTNLALNCAITARISASLLLSYSHGDNGTSNQGSSNFLGGSSAETTFDITPSVRYAITHHCAVNAGYRYTNVDRGSGVTALGPNQAITSYTRNLYFAGITLSF